MTLRLRSLLALPFLVAGCRDATEVTLVLGTDISCVDGGYQGTNISVVSTQTLTSQGQSAVFPAASTMQCGGLDGGIGTLTVIPGPNGNGPFIVTVTTGAGNVNPDDCSSPDGGLPATCVVERREVTLIDHTPAVLPVAMLKICEGVVCPAGTTCSSTGACVTESVVLQPNGTLTTPDAADVVIPAMHHDAGLPHDAGRDVTGGADAGRDATLADVGVPHDASQDTTLHDHDTGVDAHAPKDSGEDTGMALSCPEGGVRCDGGCKSECTEVVATHQRFPWAIAVQNGVLYWSKDCQEDVDGGGGSCASPSSTVMSRPTGSDAAAVAVASAPAPVWAIATTPDMVAWTATGPYVTCTVGSVEGDCIGQVAAKVRDGGTILVAPSAAAPLGVALDGRYVYWVQNQNGGAVLRSPLDGGAMITLAKGQDSPGGIAVQGSSVYWTTYGGGNGNAGLVQRVALDGGTSTTIGSQLNFVVGVTAADGGLYWLEQGYDGNLAGSVDGTNFTSVPTVLGAWSLAVDDSNIYWADVSGGRIFKASRSGGMPVAIVTDAGSPMNVALDDASVYWTNNGVCPDGGPSSECTGTVMKHSPK